MRVRAVPAEQLDEVATALGGVYRPVDRIDPGPAVRSTEATSRLFCWAAKCNGVKPSRSLKSGSCPAASSARACAPSPSTAQ